MVILIATFLDGFKMDTRWTFIITLKILLFFIGEASSPTLVGD